jgi:flagellar assembly protein FliH
MSSRLLRPGDPLSTSPVVFRQVGHAGLPAGAAGGPRASAEDPLAALERECERREQAARSAGLAEGEAAGRGRAAAELQPVLQRLARSIEEIGHLRARLRREAEADMLQLSLAIARRVLRREMAVDPDAMHGLVLGALEKLQSREICRVRVHPSHAAQLSAWLLPLAGAGPIEVVADASREPGDVIFETARGNLDASVDSQLREIERGLADRLRRSHEA